MPRFASEAGTNRRFPEDYLCDRIKYLLSFYEQQPLKHDTPTHTSLINCTTLESLKTALREFCNSLQ
jgi:hypothetical protein